LGSFSDAFKSGQQAKQTGIDRARQKESDQTQNAQAWVTNVLAPVVTEAANDVAADGKIVMRDNSDSPKIESEVTIAMNGKPPTRLTFIADENGAIKFYRDRSQGNTLGTIATVSQAQVRQLFIQTLQRLAGPSWKKFARIQANSAPKPTSSLSALESKSSVIIADIAISIRECFAGASHVSEIDGTPRSVIHRP
jgi:hypothetical protein